jgi:RHS repeat-associated protein
MFLINIRTIADAYDSYGRRTHKRLPKNTYTHEVESDDPVAYYQMNDHTTAVMKDLSGNNQHGVYAGNGGVWPEGPAPLTGDDAQSVSFDGNANGHGAMPHYTLHRTVGTIEAWFKTSSSGVVLGMSNAAATAYVPTMYVGADGKLRAMMWTGGAATPITTPGTVNNNQWHHAVLRFSTNFQSLFLDGALVGGRNGTIDNLDMERNWVGRGWMSSTWPSPPGGSTKHLSTFNGSIANVAVYATSLSDSRITAHHSVGTTAGKSVQTSYYTNNTSAFSGCTAVAGIVGLEKTTTEVDPDGTDPAIVRHTAYDAWGRIVGNKEAAVANPTCTEYDSRGRVKKTIDRAAVATTTNYNDATQPGKVTQTFTDSAGTPRTTVDIADLLGRDLTYQDELGTITRSAYDQAGRATATYRTFAGGAETQLTSIAFDPFGRPASTSEHLSGGARTTTIGYDEAGRASTIQLPNGIFTMTGHDASLGYVNSLTNVAAGGAHLSDWTYQEDLAGRITVDTHVGVRTRNYSYDAAGRLTQTVEGATTRLYAYERNSNRCALAATCSTDWEYDAADKLLASPQATSYTYGNSAELLSSTRTDGKLETIAYDGNLHAKTIDDGTNTVSETLAPSGRVLRRRVTVDAGGAVLEDVEYGYDDAEDSPAYSRPYGGGAVTSYIGALTDVNGTGSWNIVNGHGDIVGTADSAATFTAVPSTDEFGVGAVPASRLGWLGSNERFTASPSLGLIRMGVRLYDPALGRFLQVDPVEGGSANDYEYCFGDPVNCFDLDGAWGFKMPKLRSVLRGAAIVGGIVGAVACGASVVCGVAAGAAAGAAAYAASNAGTRRFSVGGLVRNAAIGGALGWGGARLTRFAAGSRWLARPRALPGGFRYRIHFDRAVHPFRRFGNQSHWQVNVWRPRSNSWTWEKRFPVWRRF